MIKNAAPSPDVFEKLASFYLGRQYDLDAGEVTDELLMYDAKDLCTHAMCVGMTGSGKTGLCLSLLEEAAIDGIPAICVDPKGDLANLMLAFPDMKPSDFQPWIEPAAAARKGQTVAEAAQTTATMWREGLADWGQTPARVAKFRDSVDVNIYTPGSNIGLPITVLRSFDPPPPEIRDDADAMGEAIGGAASGLLTLMGIEADPLLSREHILISSILRTRWSEGTGVSIGELIGLISSPPIERVGVMDLESFMPATERSKLAMRLNNLLASPTFASWLEGSPLSIADLLHTPEGKPRLSILSIAHLSDRERMFFVTILLNELVAWMRTQSGTSSLRAMFYMDEVAGYFPPVANPPSKPPMLTLLKQARAFGLGVTLATQNPVDLDYKGLSNIGTWFLGRLQTERDKARVLEGLEGAAVQSGSQFDAARMDKLLASLGNRVFLMNNVHDDGPTLFQTRWAMSYLAGPLARDQISDLMADRRGDVSVGSISESATASESAVESSPRPIVPAGVRQRFVVPGRQSGVSGGTSRRIYRAALYAEGTLHFIRAAADLDQWRDVKRFVDCGRGIPDPFWESSQSAPASMTLVDTPEDDYSFGELPTTLCNKTKLRSFEKQFKDYLYRHHTLTLYKCPLADGYSPPPREGESLDDESSRRTAKLHFEQLVREERDRKMEALREKYAKRMKTLDGKIRKAEDRVEREQSQYDNAKMSTLISMGTSLLGAFMGRRSVSRVGTAARAGSRAMQQRDDIGRAEEALTDLAEQQRELDERLQEEIDELTEDYSIDNLKLEPIEIPPRKSDLKVDDPVVLWMPWSIDADGIATPLW